MNTLNTFDELLTGVRSATITDVSVLVREVRVKVGVLSKYVSIHIYYDPTNVDPFTFTTSLVMRNAHDGDRSAHSENEALRRAIRFLTQGYEDAVRRGEMPDDAWLVEPASARRE